MKKIIMSAVCCTLALAAAPFAAAQSDNYPTKPLRMISPFPPGGSVDTVARLVGAKLGENLGQQVIIDNRSGASGNIGTEMAARAAPDGYTLVINTLPLVTNGYLFGRVPYDVVNDFAPISLLSSSPSMLAVHPSVPARSVRELLQLAKTQPGKLNYGAAGVGTNPHIARADCDHRRRDRRVFLRGRRDRPVRRSRQVARAGGHRSQALRRAAEYADHLGSGCAGL